tara:strand:- start:3627 stop:4865 length:1239 start_codon:yes stop_codon:yes gene_type:complete
MMLISSTGVLANILITEVLPDPIGTEAGGEYVELYNPTQEVVNLSGYVLATKSSDTDVTLPINGFIKPYSFYLVSDVNFNENKDNPNWVSPDYEESMTLGNSEGYISLLHNSVQIDAIGWGQETPLKEGTPLTVENGKSFKRIFNTSFKDSQNNIEDFLIIEGDPLNSSFTTLAQNKLLFSIQIESYGFGISNISFTDDNPFENGYQIIPTPHGEKIIQVSYYLSSSGETNISFGNTTIFPTLQSESDHMYTSELVLHYYDEPGNYTLTIAASDGKITNTSVISFEYLSLAAIYLDAQSLFFEKINAGDEFIVEGDLNENTTLKPTIKNIGNIPLDIGIQGTSLKNENALISLEHIFVQFNGTYHPLDYSKQIIDLNLGLQHLQPLGFKFKIPLNASSGNYTTAVSINAIVS